MICMNLLVLCPLGWLNYGIYCYYNSPIPATQSVARTYCQQYGGDLLSIESQAEFNFIQPRAAAIIGSYNLAFVGYITLNTTCMLYLNFYLKSLNYLLIIAPGSFTWYNGKTFTGAHTSDVWWCEAGTRKYKRSCLPLNFRVLF